VRRHDLEFLGLSVKLLFLKISSIAVMSCRYDILPMRRPLHALVTSLHLISFVLHVGVSPRRIFNFGVASHSCLDSSGVALNDKVCGRALWS
jgi:hypothetical protein